MSDIFIYLYFDSKCFVCWLVNSASFALNLTTLCCGCLHCFTGCNFLCIVGIASVRLIHHTLGMEMGTMGSGTFS